MISGDSTASHMGSVKNIEKARERRTFETMPGSSATGVPDDLLQHAETVHPRMGYDMSDSIFMQEMQAADRTKESKRAMEERSALEAFRAAAIQKHADATAPSSGALSHSRRGSADSTDTNQGGQSGGDTKRKADNNPARPIAGLKIRKKLVKAEVEAESSSASARAKKKKKKKDKKKEKEHEEASASAGGYGDVDGDGEGEGEGEGEGDEAGDGHGTCSPPPLSGKKGSAAASASGRGGSGAGRGMPLKGQDEREKADDGVNATAAVSGGAGVALGLVAYSSGGEDEDSDADNT